jgi:hypothetical protein
MAQPLLDAAQPSWSERVTQALANRINSVLPSYNQNTGKAEILASPVGMALGMVDPELWAKSLERGASDARSGSIARGALTSLAAIPAIPHLRALKPVAAGIDAATDGSRVAQVLATRKAPALVMREPDSFTMAHSSPKSGIKKFDWRKHKLTGEGAAVFGQGTYGSERIMQNLGQGYASMAKRKGGSVTRVAGEPVSEVIDVLRRQQRDAYKDLEEAKRLEKELGRSDTVKQYLDELDQLDHQRAVIDVIAKRAPLLAKTQHENWGMVKPSLYRDVKNYIQDHTGGQFGIGEAPKLLEWVDYLRKRNVPVDVQGQGSQYLLRVNTPKSKLLEYDVETNLTPIKRALIGRLEQERDALKSGAKPMTAATEQDYARRLTELQDNINDLNRVTRANVPRMGYLTSLFNYLPRQDVGLVSEAVQDAGYAGWKYLDGFSRRRARLPDAGNATYNYVIVDDTNLIDVLKERRLNKSTQLEW